MKSLRQTPLAAGLIVLITSCGQLIAAQPAQNPTLHARPADPITDLHGSDPAVGHPLPPAWHLQEAVRAGLVDVHQLLAKESRAADFRKFLLSAALNAELDKAQAADRRTVAAIRSRYAADHHLLRRAEFAYMRQALDAWEEALAVPTLSELAAEARQRAAKTTKTPDPDILPQKLTAVKRAAPAFYAYLRQTGSRWQPWYDYLQKDELQRQLGLKAPNPVVLEQIYHRHVTAAFRIPTPESRRLAEALRQATLAAYAASSSTPQRQAKLRALADALETCQRSCSRQAQATLAEALSWLGRRGMVPDLIQEVARQLQRPNLLIQVSRKLAGVNVDQALRDDFDVNDSIRDTHYVGSANSTGQLFLALDPSFPHASAAVGITTVINSQTTGYNNAATIDSHSTTEVRGQKKIQFQPQGFSSQPATADADTTSQVTGISPLRWLGQRRVYREVYAQQPDTDREVEWRTAARVAGELDRQLAGQIGSLNDFYQRQIRAPLLRRGKFPPQVAARTTRGQASLSVTQTGPDGLAPTGPPPDLQQGSDLAVRIHQSYVNHLATALLAGATISERQLADRLKPWFSQVPEGLQNADPAQLWRVTFAREQPLTVKLDRQGLAVQLRGTQFQVGDQLYPGMWITAAYRLVDTADGLQGLRQEKLQIVPPHFDPHSGARLGARHQVLRTMIRRRFERLFPEQFLVGRIKLGEQPNTPQLLFDHSYRTDGWLGLAFQLAPHAATVSSSQARSGTRQQVSIE